MPGIWMAERYRLRTFNVGLKQAISVIIRNHHERPFASCGRA